VLCQHGIAGEIIVADNGSTDGSCDIAARMGVRVVRVKDKAYGHALRGGAASARGRFAAYDKNQNGALITAVRGALIEET
jgi:glycosyltransferase involved in cell wall biosynthesis